MIKLESQTNTSGNVEWATVQSECRCAHCNVSWPTKTQLIRHIRVTHSLFCPQKRKLKHPVQKGTGRSRLPKLNAFNRHLPVHKRRKFKCPNCPKTFGETYHVTRHLRDGHKTPKCVDCGKIFSSQLKLSKHSVLHKPPQFACSECGRKFFFKAAWQTHTKSAHLRTEHKCPHCNWHFSNVTELNKHLLKTHSLYVASDFKCNICHKQFKDLKGLTTHATFHRNQTVFCSQCPLKFYSASHLSHHVKQMHTVKFDMPTVSMPKASRKETNHVCAVCCRPFGWNKFLLRHHLRFHYPRAEVCTVCQQSFHSESALRKHNRRKHAVPSTNPEQMFKCGTCGKVFSNQEKHMDHIKYHEKPTLICPDCPRLFYSKPCLNSHIRFHNSERSSLLQRDNSYSNKFGCAICTGTFHLRCLLRKHLSTHNPDTFSCAKCNFQCHAKHIVARHLRNFH